MGFVVRASDVGEGTGRVSSEEVQLALEEVWVRFKPPVDVVVRVGAGHEGVNAQLGGSTGDERVSGRDGVEVMIAVERGQVVTV